MDQELFDRIYQSVVRREATYDGIYYTGVRTTRIVCRPTCKAKTPKAENVTFYPSLEMALQDGYRPCKRCKPESNGRLRPDAALAAQVDAVIEARFAGKLTLRAIAESLSVSPYHLQRVYKQVTGYSPAQKLEQTRLAHAKRLLAHSGDAVADVAAAVGYGSPSHFSAWFSRRTGRSPTEYRNACRGGDWM